MDLITSNLGVNNFEEKEKVFAEIHRLLKPAGKLCITTNPMGTFEELFAIFDQVLQEMHLQTERGCLEKYIEHRQNKNEIIGEINAFGFELKKEKSDKTNMRFADALAIMNHSLMRIAFRATWENMIRAERRAEFFQQLINRINDRIAKEGSFSMKIPLLYLEFEKA